MPNRSHIKTNDGMADNMIGIPCHPGMAIL